MNGNKRGIGLSFAWNGLKHVFKKEKNFKIHLVIALSVIIVSFFFKLTPVEWATVLLVIGLVLVMEIMNSTIERIIDYVKPEIHPKAKVIKDMSAASVLISALIAIMIGLIIFIPKIIAFF